MPIGWHKQDVAHRHHIPTPPTSTQYTHTCQRPPLVALSWNHKFRALWRITPWLTQCSHVPKYHIRSPQQPQPFFLTIPLVSEHSNTRFGPFLRSSALRTLRLARFVWLSNVKVADLKIGLPFSSLPLRMRICRREECLASGAVSLGFTCHTKPSDYAAVWMDMHMFESFSATPRSSIAGRRILFVPP